MIRIPRSEYACRCKALVAQTEPNSIVILPAVPMYIRNHGVGRICRRDSDFQYLTDFPEPEAMMALIPDRVHSKYVLFYRRQDPKRELQDGLHTGQDGTIGQYGADDAFPIGNIDNILSGLAEGRDRVCYVPNVNPDFDRRLMDWISVICSKARQGAQPPNESIVLDHLLHDQRLHKSANKVKVVHYAAEVPARAYIRTMEVYRPGLFEYRLEAELECGFHKGGVKIPTYGSIVAVGRNAYILHYRENDAAIKGGGLILIDAGCEIDYYVSSITRTPPANSRFSPEQRVIYESMLEASMAALDYIAPGRHRNEAHEAIVRTVTAGLAYLGLLRGDVGKLIVHEIYKTLYMHHVSHWLGMDVRDASEYRVGGKWRVLGPDMTMIVEPGTYIAPGNTSMAREWCGIGVRVEDDAVVTRNGYEMLTSDVPKTVTEVEVLMATVKSKAA